MNTPGVVVGIIQGIARLVVVVHRPPPSPVLGAYGVVTLRSGLLRRRSRQNGGGGRHEESREALELGPKKRRPPRSKKGKSAH